MNSLGPLALRKLCLRFQGIRTFCYIESFAGKLAQRPSRPYSVVSSSCKCNELRALGQKLRNTILRRTYSQQPPTKKRRRIISRFEDVPKNYKDENGIPFREKPLTAEEVGNIFGIGMHVDAANSILKVVHGRRVAGTLKDPSLYEDSTPIRQLQEEAALKWLRNNVQVDEEYCGGQRAEMELQELDPGSLTNPDNTGLYVPNAYQKDSESVYGRSVLDQIRETKKKQQVDKEQREKQLKKMKGEKDGKACSLIQATTSSKVEPRRRGQSSRLKYYMERAKTLPERPPDMSFFQRLWPSAVIALLVVGVSVGLALQYTPPKRSSRVWPDVPPSAATVAILIAMNTLIFGLWYHPPATRFLNKYFMSVPGYPNPWAVLGNTFSHQSLSHLCTNMVVLWLIGIRLHDDIGRGNFLAIYLSCGALSSVASLSFWAWKGFFATTSMGASGAVCGIIGAYLWLNRDQPLRLFGLFPPENWPGFPAWLLLSVVILGDLYIARGWRKGTLTTDVWAHLGGYAVGIISAEIIRRRVLRRRIEAERRRRPELVASTGN